MMNDRAFILRVIKHGEADLVIHALTQSGEKIKLFARSALKSKKRFGGGVLEPTHYVKIVYKPKYDEGLSTLLEASLIEGFDSLRSDYDRLQLALHFVALIDKVSLEGVDESRPLFDLLGNALSALQVSQQLPALKTQFELKLLYNQGVLPHLENAELFLKTTIRETPTLVGTDMSRLERDVSLLIERYLHN